MMEINSIKSQIQIQDTQRKSNNVEMTNSTGFAEVNPVVNAQGGATGANNADMEDGQNQGASESSIKAAVQRANNQMKHAKTQCEFSYHEPTKRVSIKLIDSETKEVIREIPPEDTLEMVAKRWELAGLLVDEKR